MAPIEINPWIAALERAGTEGGAGWWRMDSEEEQHLPVSATPVEEDGRMGLLPLLIRRPGGEITMVMDRWAIQKGDHVLFATGDQFADGRDLPPIPGIWSRVSPEAAGV